MGNHLVVVVVLRRCLRVALLCMAAVVLIVAVLDVVHDEQHFANSRIIPQQRHLSGWSDPRTIVEKPATSFEGGDNINNNELDVSKLRIVAFGTSKTWGAGLDHPERETYVSLLSPTAVNLGLRSTPADYPSLCLHSMIGDQIFDVIILEFSPFGGVPHHDFERLAHKLRARFPYAIMIYLPIYMLLFDVGYQQQGLQDYLRSVAGVDSPKGPDFEPTIRQLAESNLTFPCESYDIDAYRESLKTLNAYMMEFPAFSGNVKSFVLDNAQYYTGEERLWDFVHPNALGHQLIAHNVRKLLQDIHAIQPIVPQPPQSDADNDASWLGGKDRCISWFSGGKTNGVIQSTNMDLVNFTPDGSDGKWALQVGRTGGTLTVECTFPNCNIYVSYMAKGPERDYPKVIMSLHSHAQPEDNHDSAAAASAATLSPAAVVVVDPNIDVFHVRQIVHLGGVALPGLVTISIQPVPEDVNSPLRFRVTGVITTPTAN